MRSRRLAGWVAAAVVAAGSASAQPAPRPGAAPAAARYVDPANGLTLQQAIARALDREPALRAARTGIEAAEAMQLQAGLRTNPSVSFERREEPGGSDNQTMVAVQWPLDLFRRPGRLAVAGREVTAIRRAVDDRERLLAAEARARYGDVAAAVRDLAVLDGLVDATRRQHQLLRARADEGASPPLERDLLAVEVSRLEAERALQAGRVESAVAALRRVLGEPGDAALSVGDTLEELVAREQAGTLANADPAVAVEQRPDVREAEARVAVAAAKIDRAARDGRFDVSLFANYMRMDAGFPQRGLGRDGGFEPVRGLFHYVAAGAMVTVPVLNRNQGEVAAARAERRGAEAEHDAARLTARAEIAAARAQEAAAQEALQLYTAGALGLARRNLDVVAQSHELGRLTVLDVLAQQRQYIEVERAFTGALRAAYEARTALKLALGDLP